MTPFENALAEVEQLRESHGRMDEFRVSNPAFAAWLIEADAHVGRWIKMLGWEMTMALLVHCIQHLKLRFVMTRMPTTIAFINANQLSDWGVAVDGNVLHDRYFPEYKAKRMANETLGYSTLVNFVESVYRENMTPERIVERLKLRYPGQPFNERTVLGLAKRSLASLQAERETLEKS